MIPHITRGGDTQGLIQYLVGPGRANEHTQPHVITGSTTIQTMYSHTGILTSDDATGIARILDGHMRRTGTKPTGKYTPFNLDTQTYDPPKEGSNHVWHCSLSLAPGHPPVTEGQWRQIAEDFMQELGFGTDDMEDGAHWIAIHHGHTTKGGDHIHIAANIVRHNGRKVSTFHDYQRAQQAASKLEHKYGLEILESREHDRSARHDSAQAINKARKQARQQGKDPQQALTQRQRLQSILTAAAASAQTEAEFVLLARANGAFLFPRYAKNSTTEITGYRVALAGVPKEGRNWFSPSKIARDLALPRLRKRFEGDPADALDAWSNPLRHATTQTITQDQWQTHIQAINGFTRIIDSGQLTTPEALANATFDVAGYLNALAQATHDQTWSQHLQNYALHLAQHSQLKHPRRQQWKPYRPIRTTSRALIRLPYATPQAASTRRLMRSTSKLIQALANAYELSQQEQTAATQRRNSQALITNLDAITRQAISATQEELAVRHYEQRYPPTQNNPSLSAGFTTQEFEQ